MSNNLEFFYFTLTFKYILLAGLGFNGFAGFLVLAGSFEVGMFAFGYGMGLLVPAITILELTKKRKK